MPIWAHAQGHPAAVGKLFRHSLSFSLFALYSVNFARLDTAIFPENAGTFSDNSVMITNVPVNVPAFSLAVVEQREANKNPQNVCSCGF